VPATFRVVDPSQESQDSKEREGATILALALVEINAKGGIENAEECIGRRSLGPDYDWNLGGYSSRYHRIWFY
jgi:hypothetical protein